MKFKLSNIIDIFIRISFTKYWKIKIYKQVLIILIILLIKKKKNKIYYNIYIYICFLSI